MINRLTNDPGPAPPTHKNNYNEGSTNQRDSHHRDVNLEEKHTNITQV